MSALTAGERRRRIAALLQQSGEPVSASALAGTFSVSRQVIVGDVALLRAAGADITATPRGYVAGRGGPGIIWTAACAHLPEEMGRELFAIVDAGGEALDVIVEHPVYGQLTGALRLSSRYDVRQFIARCGESAAPPLSLLTEGIHLHTLSCPSDEACRRVCEALRELNILLE